MRKSLLVFLFLGNFFFSFVSKAQMGWQWGRSNASFETFDALTAAVDDSGSIYVGGNAIVTSGSALFTVIKTDAAGNNKWILSGKSYGSIGYMPCPAVSMAVNNKGEAGTELYILGYTHDSMFVIAGDTVRSPNRNAMYFLMKCSALTGNPFWIKPLAVSSSYSTGDRDRYDGQSGRRR